MIVRFLLAGLMLWATVALLGARAGPQAATVVVTLEDCLGLIAHRAAADVAYQPDVDSDGNPLVPATLADPGAVVLPTTIEVDIDVDMARRFGLPTDPDLYQAEARIGTQTWDDARLLFNGQEIIQSPPAEIVEACARGLAGD